MASLVPHPYRRSLRLTTAAVVLGVASLAAGFALRSAGVEQWRLFFVAVPVLLFCLILLPILYFGGRKEQRHIEELLAGNYLVHWRYGAAEWHRFAEREWSRMRRKSRTVIPQVMAFALAAGIVLAWIDDRVTLGRGLAWAAGLGAPLAAIVSALTWWWGRATYRARQDAPGEAFISEKGVYQNGSYVTWVGATVGLDGVKLEGGDPAVLQFSVRGHRGAVQEVRVPVPRGKEEEAGQLVAAFSGAASELTATTSVTADSVADASELSAWLTAVMARFQPDQLQFRPGETVGSAFQRIIDEEEQKVRSGTDDEAARTIKLKALEELRHQFA